MNTPVGRSDSGGSPPSVHTTGTFSVSGGDSDTPRKLRTNQQQYLLSNSNFNNAPKPLNPTAIAFESRGSAASTPPPPAMPNSIDQAPSWVPQQLPPSLSQGPSSVEGGNGGSGALPLDPQQQATAEREFMITRALLPHVARPALVAVLASILDDFPQLAPMIRYRCDRAMSAVVAQQQQQAAMQLSSPPHGMTGGGDMSPQCGSVTPPGLPRRQSRGGAGVGGRHAREDEVLEYCAVHGNMRPLKHLVYRPALGNYECIHGFHCLESSTPNSMSTTPIKDPAMQNHYHANTTSMGPAPLDAGGAAPANRAAATPPSTLDLFNGNPSAMFGGSAWQPQPSLPSHQDDLHGDDVAKLQSLLRSVRSMHDDGSV